MNFSEEAARRLLKQAGQGQSLPSPPPTALPPPAPDDPRRESNLVRTFDTRWRQLGSHLPEPEKEVPVLSTRGFSFDRAWPSYGVAVEIEGGVHKLDNRFQSDIEKYNLGQTAGWLIIRLSSHWLAEQPEQVIAWIEAALRSRGWSENR